MTANLYARLAAGFADQLSAPALLLADGTRWTFGDLIEEVDAFHRLFCALGLARGERIAVQVEKSPRALALYLAVIKYGAVYLPLNTAYQKGEIGYFLSDAEPALFVCDPAREAGFAPLAQAAQVRHVLTLDAEGEGSLVLAARGLTGAADCADNAPGDLAAILYTSGTTGRSKGAMMSHQALASNVETLHTLWQFAPDDVLIHALPLFHTHGLFVACGTSLRNGTPMHFLPRFDVEAVLARLPASRVMMGVPTFYARLLEDERLTKELCAPMRLFISGSAPLLAETWQAFHTRSGHAILERYGMTETGMNSSNPYTGLRKAGTVGFPLPDVEIKIVDKERAMVQRGSVGAIEVRGPNVFSGYWRNPEKTAQELGPDGWFQTGDLGQYDADGYLHIVGRAKDLIISGGFNVYPIEVEGVLNAIPGVAESAVFGLPHPDFGEAVAAAVTLTNLDNGITQESIIGIVKAELANYKVPKRVFLLESLPRNAMGKVEKTKLRAAYADVFSAQPRTKKTS